MEKALIYIRVSTDEQAGDERYSIKTQTKLCERGIDDSKVYVLAENGIYADPGKTATNMNRPGLQDLLLRIREDKLIKAVFVQDTDRLARNANDHLTIKAILRKAGVKLISVSQPGMEDTPEGNFMDLVIAGVNQLQSQITSRKTIKSTDQKFNDGGWPTKAPIGYKNAGEPDDDKKRIIVIDPLRAPLVTETFEMYATGDYSIIEVRDVMYKKGLISVAGKMLASSKMFELLRCHFYYGDMHWRGKIKTGSHKPIITKELFDRCQQVIAEHNRYACRKRKYSFLLNGFVFCAICGRRYTAEHHPAKDKSYYHCKRSGEGTKCTDKYVDTWDLEKQVQDEFDKLQFSPTFINKIVEKVKIIYEQKKSGISVEKKRLTSTKINLEKKLGIAEEKLLNGTFNDEDFTRIKNQIREQIDHIGDQIYKVEKSKNLKVDIIQELLGLIRNIGKAYNKASPQLKRLYLGLFWEEFRVSNKLIVEAKKAPVVIALVEIGAMLTKSKEIQKLVHTERAFVSDLYPTTNAVIIRPVMGD